MTTRLVFQTQFLEGSSDQVIAIGLRALPGLRTLSCVNNVTLHVDRNQPDVLWAIWEFSSDDDMFALYEEARYTQFLADLRPYVADRGVQTHVLADVDASLQG